MKRDGGRCRWWIVVACLWLWAVSAWAQSPTPSVTSTPSPAVSSSPRAKVTPAPPLSPPPGPSLHLPSQSPSEPTWQQRGVVGESTFMDRLRTVTWSLAIICFLIWLVSKAAGRGALERLGLPGESEALLEVLEKKRLSPGRSVMLMRVGPKVLALGLTESGFQTLTELDGEDLQAYREKRREARVAAVTPPSEPVASPSEVVKHYVSIIPGLGVKK